MSFRHFTSIIISVSISCFALQSVAENSDTKIHFSEKNHPWNPIQFSNTYRAPAQVIDEYTSYSIESSESEPEGVHFQETNNWLWSLGYYYHDLNSVDSSANQTGSVASDLSPSLSVAYEQHFAPELTVGLFASYQRAIFQLPNVNTLRDHTADAYAASAYLKYHLSNRLRLVFLAGADTSLYLNFTSSTVADIEASLRPALGLRAEIDLYQSREENPLHVSTHLEYQNLAKSTHESNRLFSSHAYKLGLHLKKQYRSNVFGIGVEYSTTEFEVNQARQDLESLQFLIHLSFGGSHVD